MTFKMETHLHTRETSACAGASAADMVQQYKDAGYKGLVVTDHFVNGNSYCDPKAPWGEQITQLLAGYKAAEKAGQRLGMTVLLGWEFPFNGEDYLTYGLGEDFLRKHPNIDQLSIEAYVQLMHENGALVVQAHPFRQAKYIKTVTRQRAELVDGIEVHNGSHLHRENPQFDERALALCNQHGLIPTSGSDAHHIKDVATGGMIFDHEIKNMEQFIAALREKRARLIT